MKTALTRTIALTAALVLAAFAGCSSSDDPAAPPPLGGGKNFVLPAGVYNTTFVVESCSGVLIDRQQSTETWCADEVVDEILGDFDCAPTPVGDDSVTVDCSGTDVLGNGCDVSWTATGGGKRTGVTWTLNVHLEVVDTPDGCYADSNCVNMVLTAERESGPPTACTYADANTFDATISGGPMAGRVPFPVDGSSSSGTGGYSWIFAGSYPEQEFAAISSAGVGEGWLIGFWMVERVDHKSLPETLFVDAGNVPPVSAGPGIGLEVIVNYSESDPQSGHAVFASGGGGTMIIQEISGTHVAGTVDMNLEMTPYGGAKASAAQDTTYRVITGGFYVTGEEDVPDQSFAVSLAQRMLQSLRGYVE